MLNFLYKSKIRIVICVVITLFSIALLLQGIIGVYYAHDSKNSSQEMVSLIIDNDTYNLSALLGRVESLVNLLETDKEYLFTPVQSATYDIIADSKTFKTMNSKLTNLIHTNITDTAFNNSFLFLSDTLPLTYVAPDYYNTFDAASRSSAIGIYAINSIKTSDWFQNMENTVDACIWVEKASGREIFCFAQNLYQKTLQGNDVITNPIGIFYISFDLATLLNQLKLSDLYPQSSVTLSYNENIIYSTSSTGINNNPTDFTYTSSLYPGLILQSHIPKYNITASYYAQFFITIIMLVLLLMLGGFLFLYVNTAIISPLEKMTHYLLKKEKIPLPAQQKLTPEIDILYQSHNIMINRVNEAMIKSRESYYKMLQSQINPHFTYNVLNSISAISLMKGDYEISETISNLVDMLRYGINAPETLVSLSDELAISEKFVAIQNFRYEKDIIIKYDIPEDLLNTKMPKLTIQPLIENSIFHCNTSLCDQDIYIQVHASASDDVVKITICDNNKADIDILNKHLQNEDMRNSSDRRGLGIYNINQRLSLIFGPQYGLHYESDGSGLRTIVNLPISSQSLPPHTDNI